MKIIHLVPGSPEWLQSRSASKAPVMMGDSIYQSRTDLLRQMATGITKEVDAATQARFNNGHRTEALARAIAEEMLGEELSPISASDDAGYLTANYDGITFPYRKGFEHKDWNETLAASVRDGVVPNSHAWQLDQQILVGNLESVLFVVSDGTTDNFAHIEYRSTKERAEALMAGWRQFDIDLANYQHIETKPEAVGAPIKDLPAVTYEINGLSVVSNIDKEVKPAVLALIEQFKRKPETDQDFADLDNFNKKARDAVKRSEAVRATFKARFVDIDAFERSLVELEDLLTTAAISGEKTFKSEKDNRKAKILMDGKAKYEEHLATLQAGIVGVCIAFADPDWAKAVHGLKTLDSYQNAVNTCLASAIIAADMIAKDVRTKLEWCKDNAAGMSFLFPDLQQIIAKPMDDFTLLIQSRIKEHKDAEARKEAELLAKVEAEAAAKLETERACMQAEAEAKARATMEAEKRAAEEEQRKAELVKHVTQHDPVAMPPVAKPDNVAVIEHQDEISAFLASRDFGKEVGKIRAILVEFVKFDAQFRIKKEA